VRSRSDRSFYADEWVTLSKFSYTLLAEAFCCAFASGGRPPPSDSLGGEGFVGVLGLFLLVPADGFGFGTGLIPDSGMFS